MTEEISNCIFISCQVVNFVRANRAWPWAVNRSMLIGRVNLKNNSANLQ